MVPWFPRRLLDFDLIGKRILSQNMGILEVDHPSFTDPNYKVRKLSITSQALKYSITDSAIPDIDYTD